MVFITVTGKQMRVASMAVTASAVRWDLPLLIGCVWGWSLWRRSLLGPVRRMVVSFSSWPSDHLFGLRLLAFH